MRTVSADDNNAGGVAGQRESEDEEVVKGIIDQRFSKSLFFMLIPNIDDLRMRLLQPASSDLLAASSDLRVVSCDLRYKPVASPRDLPSALTPVAAILSWREATGSCDTSRLLLAKSVGSSDRLVASSGLCCRVVVSGGSRDLEPE